MTRSVILTGIRSNANPTLGNYLGAIMPMVDLASRYHEKYQINMFVPDLHSITTPIKHIDLPENTINTLKIFAAAGLPWQNESVHLYRQSYVPAHTQLMWILSCITNFGEARRMIEFKDKSDRLKDSQVSVGLFVYPILMAADILLYDAEWIPVGEDQRQHIELARDLANRFNYKFGEIFKSPEPLTKQEAFINRDSAPRIRSLTNPDQKMSKSLNDPAGTISLNDPPQEAAKKILAATTDSFGKISLDWVRQPGISNLLQIYALLSNQNLGQVVDRWQGKASYSELKKTVSESIAGFLNDFQTRAKLVDTEELLKKVRSDEVRINNIANDKLYKIQKAVGLRANG